jgi:hypothetical protein
LKKVVNCYNLDAGFRVRCGEREETMKQIVEKGVQGTAHCPICTHTVPAIIDILGKRARVSPGQRCPRCASSLDVAIVVQIAEAA